MIKNKNKINQNKYLLDEVKASVLQIEPDAEVYLFGSRARNDNNNESDWDFLVLLPGIIDYERKRKILDALFDIELSTGEIFNDIIRSKEFWNENKLVHASPFYKNVNSEAVLL